MAELFAATRFGRPSIDELVRETLEGLYPAGLSVWELAAIIFRESPGAVHLREIEGAVERLCGTRVARPVFENEEQRLLRSEKLGVAADEIVAGALAKPGGDR